MKDINQERARYKRMHENGRLKKERKTIGKMDNKHDQ